MIAPLLIALAGVAIVGIGGYIFVNAARPGPVDARAAIRNTVPTSREAADIGEDEWNDYRLGRLATQAGWAERMAVPEADIALMNLTAEEFLGRKIKLSGLGIVLGFVFVGMPAYVLGASPSITTYVLVAAAVATGLWFVTGRSVHQSAEKRRAVISQVLAPYSEMVALARNAGEGSHQSLYRATQVSDMWVFVEIQNVLDRAALNGVKDEVALRRWGQRIQVKAIEDLAGLLAVGRDGSVSEALRAHAASVRESALYEEKGRAVALNTKLGIPMAGLVVVFLIALSAPAVISFMEV